MSGAMLLGACDPAPFTVERPDARSGYVVASDHAGCALPRALLDLGVPEAERLRHIGWDLGIAGVARRLSAHLDAFLILQTYSRLVIDCNRAPGSPQSILTRSERTAIHGNVGLSADDAARREAEIFQPYHARLAAELDARAAAARPTVLLLLHSFTPVYLDDARRWHAGVLYDRDARVGHALLALLRAEPGLEVGDNQPYAASPASDYTLTTHGERRGVPYVEIELRQDLIADDAGQEACAARLARLLPRACAGLL
jgi:predicted N-formylglutamate amidohydrolase